MKKHLFWTGLLLTLLTAHAAMAQSTWTGTNSSLWNDSLNWIGGIPTDYSIIYFDSNSTTNLNTYNDLSSLMPSAIYLNDPAGDVSISGNPLGLSYGIDLSNATHDLTVNSDLTLLYSNYWNVAAGRTVTSSGVLDASYDYTDFEKQGLGSVVFSNIGNTNVLSKGDFIIREGTVDFNGGTGSKHTLQKKDSSTFGSLQIGTAYSTDTAVLKIDSGTVDALSYLSIAGADGPADVDGKLIMTGGTLSLGSGRATGTGGAAGAKAVIEMSGDAYWVSSYGSTAGAAISSFSSAAGSVTDMTMHNSATLYQQGGFYIGGSGAVNLTMDGDTVFRGRRSMIFASAPTSSAILNLSGNALVESLNADSTNAIVFGDTGGTCKVTLSESATLKSQAGQLMVVGATNGCMSQIYVNGGTMLVGGLSVGRMRSGSGIMEARGAIYQTAGTVVSQNAVGSPKIWRIGGDKTITSTSDVARQNNSVYGYYGLSGTGSVDLHADDLIVGDGCTGVVDQSGGAFTTAGNVYLAEISQLYHTTTDTLGASAGYGELNVVGGTFDFTDPAKEFVVSVIRPKTYLSGGSPITTYYQGRGVLNVGGTGVVTTAAPITVAKDAEGGAPDVADYRAIINLGIAGNPGGTLNTPGIQVNYAGGNGTLNFHGGTLVATADNTDFVHAGTRIWSDGATIDTNGHDVTMSNGIAVPAGNGIESVEILDGGAGYVGAPFLVFYGGYGATGYPVMVDDGTGTGGLKIDHIVITNPGINYNSSPTIAIAGSATTPATVGTIAVNSGNEGGGLDKIGDGTLTFASPEDYNSICRGVFNLKQGTVVFNGGATSKYVIADATLAGVKGRINVGDSTSLESTTLQVDSGYITTNSNAEFYLGAGEGASGIEARLFMTGGTLEVRRTYTGAATDVSAVIQMSGTANFVSSYSSTSNQAVSTFSSAAGSSLDITMHDSAYLYQQGGFYVGGSGDVNLTMDGDTTFIGKRTTYFASGTSSNVTLDLSGNALVESLKWDSNSILVLGQMGQFKATLAESATIRSQAGQMIYVGYTEGGRGRIYMNGGSLQAGGLSLGRLRSGGMNGQGAIYQTAGVAVSQNDVGSPGAWRLGGDDTYTDTSDVARQGSGVYGYYALSGTGSVDLHADDLYVGDGGTGVIDQSGGSFTTAGNVYLGYVSQLYHSSSDTLGGSAGAGDLNVTAGTFTTTDPSKEFVVSATRPKTY
ncbi:MAG: hypothetical protein JXB10_15875, partial [Pirellulales bacterium]|nr:hypothetical protein [Pirellulales bacterium]